VVFYLFRVSKEGADLNHGLQRQQRLFALSSLLVSARSEDRLLQRLVVGQSKWVLCEKIPATQKIAKGRSVSELLSSDQEREGHALPSASHLIRSQVIHQLFNH
jgi:hypothetical protein